MIQAQASTVTTPWGQGYDACRAGEPLDSCPYEAHTETQEHGEYVAGWWEAWIDLERQQEQQ